MPNADPGFFSAKNNKDTDEKPAIISKNNEANKPIIYQRKTTFDIFAYQLEWQISRTLDQCRKANILNETNESLIKKMVSDAVKRNPNTLELNIPDTIQYLVDFDALTEKNLTLLITRYHHDMAHIAQMLRRLSEAIKDTHYIDTILTVNTTITSYNNDIKILFNSHTEFFFQHAYAIHMGFDMLEKLVEHRLSYEQTSELRVSFIKSIIGHPESIGQIAQTIKKEWLKKFPAEAEPKLKTSVLGKRKPESTFVKDEKIKDETVAESMPPLLSHKKTR